MFEWYDLRMIDLYPEETVQKDGLTPPQGVIGEPREEIADYDELLFPDEIKAALTRSGEPSAAD